MWNQTISNKQYDTKELASFILKQFMEEVKNRSIYALKIYKYLV